MNETITLHDWIINQFICTIPYNYFFSDARKLLLAWN